MFAAGSAILGDRPGSYTIKDNIVLRTRVLIVSRIGVVTLNRNAFPPSCPTGRVTLGRCLSLKD